MFFLFLSLFLFLFRRGSPSPEDVPVLTDISDAVRLFTKSQEVENVPWSSFEISWNIKFLGFCSGLEVDQAHHCARNCCPCVGKRGPSWISEDMASDVLVCVQALVPSCVRVPFLSGFASEQRCQHSHVAECRKCFSILPGVSRQVTWSCELEAKTAVLFCVVRWSGFQPEFLSCTDVSVSDAAEFRSWEVKSLQGSWRQ